MWDYSKWETHPKLADSSSLSVIIHEMLSWQPASPHLLMLAAQHQCVKSSTTTVAAHLPIVSQETEQGRIFGTAPSSPLMCLPRRNLSSAARVSCHFPSRPRRALHPEEEEEDVGKRHAALPHRLKAAGGDLKAASTTKWADPAPSLLQEHPKHWLAGSHLY